MAKTNGPRESFLGKNNRTKSIILFVLAILVLIGLNKFDKHKETKLITKEAAINNTSNTITPITPLASGYKSYVISGNNKFGCEDKNLLKKLVEYASQGDNNAYISVLSAGISEGLCTNFGPDEEVCLSDTAVFSGLVKIRRKDNFKEYWTYMGTINTKVVNDISKEEKLSSKQRDGTVGVWYDDLGDPTFSDSTLTIKMKNGKYYVNRKNGDGSHGTYELVKNENKYTMKDDKFGLYYLAKENDLGIYDNSGYIRTAKRKL